MIAEWQPITVLGAWLCPPDELRPVARRADFTELPRKTTVAHTSSFPKPYLGRETLVMAVVSQHFNPLQALGPAKIKNFDRAGNFISVARLEKRT